jgi:hypothetical protein
MADTTWTALNVQNANLIRKTLAGGVAMIAPYSAAAITSLTTDTTTPGTPVLQTVPTDYKKLGLMSEDGATFPRDIDTSDVNSWGISEPTRTDIRSDVSSCKIILQETNINTMSLYLGTALTALEADEDTGEVVTDKPATPPLLYFRLLVVARDVTSDGEFYFGRFFPRAQITDRDEQNWGGGDDPIQYGITFQAKYDTTLATSERFFFAGAGWKARAVEMGFTLA